MCLYYGLHYNDSVNDGADVYINFYKSKWIHFVNGNNIKEQDLARYINVYPNPASTYVQVESKKYKIKSIEVYDIYGRHNLTFQGFETLERFDVDISTLQKGIYFIKIQTDKGTLVKKFVKN